MFSYLYLFMASKMKKKKKLFNLHHLRENTELVIHNCTKWKDYDIFPRQFQHHTCPKALYDPIEEIFSKSWVPIDREQFVTTQFSTANITKNRPQPNFSSWKQPKVADRFDAVCDEESLHLFNIFETDQLAFIIVDHGSYSPTHTYL